MEVRTLAATRPRRLWHPPRQLRPRPPQMPRRVQQYVSFSRCEMKTDPRLTLQASPVATSTALSATGGNLQTFAGALGGILAPPVTAAGNQFQVQGNALFKDLSNALTRSCDVQHNKCADAANASGNKGALTVAACGDQQTQCNASH